MKGSKTTRIETWKRAEEISGRTPAQLKGQPILGGHLIPTWNAYCLIASGVEGITLQDILAYTKLCDDELERWQIDAIIALDNARQKEWQTQLQS